MLTYFSTTKKQSNLVNTIVEVVVNDRFAHPASMPVDGNTIFVGALNNGDNGDNSVEVRVLRIKNIIVAKEYR